MKRRELLDLLGRAAAWPPSACCRYEVPTANEVLTRILTSRAKTHRMRATSFAALLLLSYIFAVVAARAVEEDAGVGIPPALEPGQAPPLPKPGPLAEPRSSSQVGFPTLLTKYVISPSTLRPARVALGQKLFFEPRLSGDGTVACATATIRRGPSPTAGPCQLASMAASASATPQPY